MCGAHAGGSLTWVPHKASCLCVVLTVPAAGMPSSPLEWGWMLPDEHLAAGWPFVVGNPGQHGSFQKVTAPLWLWLVGCLVASDFVCGPWGGQCILTPGPSVEADRPRPGPKACGQDQRGDSSGRVCGFGQGRASQTCPACVSTAAPQATMAACGCCVLVGPCAGELL